MSQLSVKVQDALLGAGFEAALQKNGEHQFLYGTSSAVLRVKPLTGGGVRFSATGSGRANYRDVPAATLEEMSDKALLVFFDTLATLA